MIDNKLYPHPLRAGSKFRLLLSSKHQPIGRITKKQGDLFWFRLFDRPGKVYGPWCFLNYAGPVKKWKVVVTHHTPSQSNP